MVVGDLAPGVVEPSFSDSEYGFVDDITDEELVGAILHKKPQKSVYSQSCIIISGIPIVGEDRLNKLKGVLGKIFVRISETYNDYYPLDENSKTKGWCFVEFPSAEVAGNATAILDGYVLDKNHTFSANLFEDLDKFKEPSLNWKPPEMVEYTPTGDFWSWLQNEKCYDQFAALYDREIGDKKVIDVASHVGVFEFRKGQDPQLISERTNWTETFFQWSPHGTFLTSVHVKGICLWAGKDFDRFGRFLVTYATPENRWVEDTDSLRIWEVQTGEMRKGFSLFNLQGDDNQLSCWPFFQWSYDEKYVACFKAGGNGISVYETDNFTLLDKKPITIEGLCLFEWSPARPILAYYCEERTSDNAPAEIGLMEFPSKVKLRALRVFSVSKADLFWNKNGDRLAAHTERYQKKIVKPGPNGVLDVKYSKPTSHIEIFDLRNKEISVLSMTLAETYVAFGWEPAGDKFCVLAGTQHKTTPLIYMLDMSKHVPQLISKFEPSEKFNNVSWAPAGGWLVVYSANSTSGAIMFIDSNGPEPTRTNIVEYSGFTKGSWDPTGRYFVAAFTMGGGRSSASSDTGYRIFTFQGKELFRKNLDRMMQFKWRPRPPVKLPEETVRLVRKTLKETSARFEEEDKRERGRASQEVTEKRRKNMKEFNQIREQYREIYNSEAKLRASLRPVNEEEEELDEETIAVPLTTERVKIQETIAEDEK
uniref:Eukaryotic translation initiation factor 3 subunit B n=1 Tax=Syphacia muris TaxID=451379 RepID=A0A0N5AHI8_9BILA